MADQPESFVAVQMTIILRWGCHAVQKIGCGPKQLTWQSIEKIWNAERKLASMLKR